MALTPSSPITGGAQTGLTSPTYTVVADSAPDVNSIQFAVTALGGTQTGVTSHTQSSPFTLTAFRPKSYRALGKANPVTGVVNQVPRNTTKILVRKGVLPLAGQPASTMQITVSIDAVAGSETADPNSLRAALSLLIGYLTQVSAGVGDSTVTGIL